MAWEGGHILLVQALGDRRFLRVSSWALRCMEGDWVIGWSVDSLSGEATKKVPEGRRTRGRGCRLNRF